MLRFVSKNLRQKRSHGLAFSLFFFILCLLNANTVLAASVTLTWDAPTTNADNTALTDLSGYRVYMSTTSGQYNSGNIVKNNIPASSPNGGVTETTTVDNLPNGTYYFIVTAYDIYGNESGNSNEIQKTTTGGDTQAPTVPAGLSAQAISSSQINLSWAASTDNVGVTGYRIYRCLGSNCTPTTQIATSTTTSYSNTGLSASTAYTYTVSAYDAAGNVSSQSASASATTASGSSGDTQAPTVPIGLSGQAFSISQINLSWTASTDNVGVTGYRIYRNGALIDTSATNSYSNTGLSASTTYTYTVSAYDAAGNVSSQSSSANATTASSGGSGTQTASSSGDSEISGGGCGFVKDDSDKPNSDKGQFAMNMTLLLLSLIFIRMRRLWRTKWAALFMFGVLLLQPNIASAAVNLPWSTTYNCPEWKQTDGNPNCDGLTEYGAWTTNDGKEEQITSVANYPGGTGRGQRHWLGDGYTVNSGGTRIEFTSPQSELWIRWYMRFQNGFQWNPLSEFKILYLDVAFTSRVIVGYRSWDRLGIVANGYSYDSPSGNGWNTIMANGGTDANGNKTSDGQWHMYEIHLKMDTNGSNGIIEWWVDGVKRSSRSDVNYQTQGGWSTIVIGSNSIFPANGPVAYYVDYDDMVISTTGTIGGSLPDQIAPSPPSGLW